MKLKFSLGAGLLALAVAVVTGCQTLQPVHPMPVSEIGPEAHERLVLDQLYILADTSSSMKTPERFPEQKAFLQAFATAIPSGAYEVAAGNFGGPDAREWTELPIHAFDRGALEHFADHLVLQGGTTDMHLWLRSWEPEVSVREGRAAVLILSDGRAPLVDTMLAVRDLAAAHQGRLCVFAIQFGDDPEGAWLLRELTRIAGCGTVWNYDAINSPEGMASVVRRIFFETQPELVDEVGEFNNILFDFDQSVVRPEYNELLDAISLFLQNNPGARVRLEGHTDSRGSQAYNQGLSERRAEAVRRALLERGINAQRIETVGYSLNRPVRPNDTEANMALNRRVEIQLVR